MSEEKENRRPLEAGIKTALADRLTYSGYLGLDRLLSAQEPLSEPRHHDEMLFIVQHQVAELWMKLIIHELRAACEHIAADNPGPVSKILSRVKQVQRQLSEQWSVLATLTPTEYVQFRGALRSASGFQSLQYRLVEFLLGNKNHEMIKVFRHDPEGQETLRDALEAPSLYDEFLCFLARRGHAIDGHHCERDWSIPHVRDEGLVPVYQRIYEQPNRFWEEYELCEKLVDVEESFQLWRFRHLQTVERVIGFKAGTGGSSGVGFLRKALDLTFFPELMDVRTALGQ